MSREIKFRAWDKKDGGMIVQSTRKYPVILYDTSLADWAGKDDLILMQFTGLLDKNGVEIYEGDIIKADGMSLSVIEFKEGGFCLRYLKTNDTNQIYRKSHIKIIGNIYENPELLED